MKKTYNRRPNTKCSICKTKIYRRPIHIQTGNVYCSLKCNGISQRALKICPLCDKRYIGLKRTCSRACANRARKGISYTGENKNNKAYVGTALKKKLAKKRGGICEKCKMTNYTILQTHHKVERANGGTDNMSNLELLCPNCHMTHHLGSNLFNK